MIVEVIQDLARLNQIEPEWTTSVRENAVTTPFQLPIWLLIWWKHFGSGKLYVLTFRQGSRLVAVIPCFLHEWLGRRQLTLIGSGISDYLDPYIAPEHSGEVIRHLQMYLEQHQGWDLCDWQDLSPETPLRNIEKAKIEAATPCSEIELNGSFDLYFAALSKDLKRNIRRYSERAKQIGTVEFEASTDGSHKHLDTLIRLHTQRWEKQGQPGMVAANQSEPFLRDVVPQFARIGLIRYFTISFENEVAALLLSFSFNNRIFAYMTAFDPKYDSLGFGRTLLFEAIRHAYLQGYSRWNFLRGDEPFKAWWGAKSEARCRVIIDRQGVCGT